MMFPFRSIIALCFCGQVPCEVIKRCEKRHLIIIFDFSPSMILNRSSSDVILNKK